MRQSEFTYRSLATETKRLDDTGRGLTHGYLNYISLGIEHPTIRAIELIAAALTVEPRVFSEYVALRARRELDPRHVEMKTLVQNVDELLAAYDALGERARADHSRRRRSSLRRILESWASS
jgi:hypothetical protein